MRPPSMQNNPKFIAREAARQKADAAIAVIERALETEFATDNERRAFLQKISKSCDSLRYTRCKGQQQNGGETKPGLIPIPGIRDNAFMLAETATGYHVVHPFTRLVLFISDSSEEAISAAQDYWGATTPSQRKFWSQLTCERIAEIVTLFAKDAP
jgi:hypothetical protein